MNSKDAFIELLSEQKLEQGEVIFLLQGDALHRAPYAAELFKKGMAKQVALVGNANDRSYGSYPLDEVRDELLKHGVPSSALFFEQTSPHTRAEAERAMELAKIFGWQRILIVTSPHHQYRAFLTFLKAMKDASMDLVLIQAVAPLSMTEETPWGKREELLGQEFARIEEYQKKGDVASYEDGVHYLESL